MNVKNFVAGMGSILNIFPEPPKSAEKNVTAPEEKIKSAFNAVGKEMYISMEKIKNGYKIGN